MVSNMHVQQFDSISNTIWLQYINTSFTGLMIYKNKIKHAYLEKNNLELTGTITTKLVYNSLLDYTQQILKSRVIFVR